MRTTKRLTGCLLVLVIVGVSAAWAKDAIKESVANAATGSPIITQDGNPYAQGTYAVGTIHLLYTVDAYNFTPGQSVGSFDVNWTDVGGYSSGPNTVYAVSSGPNPYSGITFNLYQNGGQDLVVSPNPGSFLVTEAGQSGTSHVTVTVNPAWNSTDTAANCDGCELVGHLQSNTDPSGAHLDTVTTIVIHVKLVYPAACLRVYDFITDEAFTTTLITTDVNVRWDKKLAAYVVTATNPGQWSDNVLLVNNCADPKFFDLKVTLDPHFGTSGNGNATFVYTTAGPVDPSSFSILSFGTGTPKGQALCIPSLSVPAHDTFLATVHTSINRGIWTGGTSGTFTFSGEVDMPNTVLLTDCSGGTPHPDVLPPNPASATVSYTQK